MNCAECRGSFFDVHGGGVLGCGWHRDRGSAVCTNTLRVAASEVEARVLGAIRDQILVPEHVAYAVDRACALVAEKLRGPSVESLRRELAEVEAKIERLIALAEAGGLEVAEVATRLRERRAERDRILGALESASAPAFDVETLRALIESRVLEVREALLGSPDLRRQALAALLGPTGRLRVAPDPERSFRVEGTCYLSLDAGQARDPEDLRARRSFGSGGGI